MALKIIWARSAQTDREKVFRFWNDKTQSREYSGKLNTLIELSIRLIKKFPESGLSTDYKDVRYHLVEKHYKLFYRVEGEMVFILRFWDTRQDPERLSLSE